MFVVMRLMRTNPGLTQSAMNCATTNQVPFEKRMSFKGNPHVCSDAIYRINT